LKFYTKAQFYTKAVSTSTYHACIYYIGKQTKWISGSS